MNSQLEFNSTDAYQHLSQYCKFVGFLCGKPVYSYEHKTVTGPEYNRFKFVHITPCFRGN
jgi:hypothetical protein